MDQKVVNNIAGLRDPQTWAPYIAALPECNFTVVDGTSAVTFGTGLAGDCRLYRIVILKNAGPATATVTGFNKVAQGGATAAVSPVFSGSTADDRVIDFGGAVNDAGALTVTASVDELVGVWWRPAKLLPAQFTAQPARNALPAGLVNWNLSGSQKWTKTEVSGGTVTVNADGSITCATNGASGRAMMEFDIAAALTSANLNKTVFISAEVVDDFTGPTAQAVIFMAGTNTISAGSTAGCVMPSGVTRAGSRIGMQIVLSAVTSATVRFGIGCDSAEGAAATIKLRNPVVEICDSRSAGPFGEAIPISSDALFDYVPNVTFSGTNAGVLTMPRTQINPAFGEVVLCVGDSFGNDSGLYADLSSDWPDMLRLLRPDWAMVNRCVSGTTLATMASSIASWLSPTDQSSAARKISKVVIQGGINSIIASATLANNPVPAMMDSVATMAQAAKAAQITPENIVFVGVSPCSGYASYDATKGHNQKITLYNAMLRAFCARNGYGYANTYDRLRASSTSLALATQFDSGDGLHPNNPGFKGIAELIDAAFSRGTRRLRDDGMPDSV